MASAKVLLTADRTLMSNKQFSLMKSGIKAVVNYLGGR